MEHELAIDEIRSPYLYLSHSPIHTAITSLKYGGMRSVAAELAELLCAFVQEKSPHDADLLIGVPSHRASGWTCAFAMTRSSV